MRGLARGEAAAIATTGLTTALASSGSGGPVRVDGARYSTPLRTRIAGRSTRTCPSHPPR